MKISIVLTTYNGELYITDQIESLRNQTREADEVLIYDDGSTDSTVPIIGQFIEDYNLSKWKLVVNKTNLGWRKNFMQGIWESSGELVFTCDQDDIWDTRKLEIMEEIMTEHPDILLLTSRYREFFEGGKQVVGPEQIIEDLKRQEIGYNFFKVPYPGSTYCISRRLVNESRSVWFDEAPHDAILWRIALLNGKLYTCKNVLVNVRKHDSTYTLEAKTFRSIAKRESWLEYAAKCLVKLEEYIQDNSLSISEKTKNVLAKNKKWICIRHSMFRNKKLLSAIQLLGYLNCYERPRQYLADLFLVLRIKFK